MMSVSSRLCSGASCASKTDSPASPKMSLWIIKKICLSPQINRRWKKQQRQQKKRQMRYCRQAAASCSFLPRRKLQFVNALRCRCKWLMAASFTPNSIHEMTDFFPGCCHTNGIISRLTCRQERGIEKPIVCARIWIEDLRTAFVCARAGVEDLRFSGECWMDRSYRGINLKLALLYACECWLPKAWWWFLPIDSQFRWSWMKTFKGKTAIGHKVCDLLRFSSPSLLFFPASHALMFH